MTTGVKVGIGIALIFAFTAAVYAGGKKIVSSVTYKLKGFGDPLFNGNLVTVPVNIQFSNGSLVPLPIDHVSINLSYLNGKQFVQAGTVSKSNITIQPGDNITKFLPVIDLKALFSNVLDTIASTVLNKGLEIRADVAVTVAGVTVTDTLYHKLTKK